ncbi:hypothetical protein, partial [Pseudohoeflea coraliihabitans]
MNIALIDANGLVVETRDLAKPESFIASDGLTRVDIPSGADWQVGGTWDGSAYSDPPGHADKVQA